jgi:hypothetical protein
MLRERRQELRALLGTHLELARRDGRQDLRPNEKAMLGDLRQLDARIKHQESEVARTGNLTFGVDGRRGAIHLAG